LLVGGAYNAERPDLFLNMELGQYNLLNSSAGVHGRQKDGGGTIPGSAGVFLVLESAEHAKARGAKAYAKLGRVASDLGPREEAETRTRFETMMDDLEIAPSQTLAVISGASGCTNVTNWEFEALKGRMGMETPLRAFTTMTGNPMEANFPFAIALAALALKNEDFYPAFEPEEKPVKLNPSSILVSTAGHYRGEGMVTVEKAS
jgi:3-oxoacyl-[acyl-carrier-protein] synthase II